jgi:HSP20 family protein
MNVGIWDPFREMETLLDRYTAPARKVSTTDDNRPVETGDLAPVVDIMETDNEFILRVELPGVEKDDVQVNIDNRILIIKGEKKNENKDKKIHRSECIYGSFVRNFTLPQDVEIDKVEAAYKNGLLNLTLPKMEQAKPKQIEVKVN